MNRKALEHRLRRVMSVPPLPFQVDGVQYVQDHDGRALIGDEQGLGKTYQAIAHLAINPHLRPAVIICPATLKWMWKTYLRKWAGLRSTVLMAHKRYGLEVILKGRPSSRRFRTKEDRRVWIADNADDLSYTDRVLHPWPMTAEIVVINYDILEDWMDYLVEFNPMCVIADECQKVKTIDTIRTTNVRELSQIADSFVPLSGTPMMKRPIELFPVLNMIAPNKWPSQWKYAFRYCSPKRGWKNRGWDFTGASNLKELRKRLRKYMIRRLKKNVLKDLPPKTYTTIPVDLANRKEYDKAEREFISWVVENHGTAAAKRAMGAEALVRAGVLRRLSAQGKVPAVCDWIKDWIETGNKLVVFAVHKSVVAMMAKRFPTAARVDGSIVPEMRKAEEYRFQNDPKCRLFIGNIEAAGVGLTLTAAPAVAFIEQGRSPAEDDQAADRIHRIGQKSKRVQIFRFVGHDTIDQDTLKRREHERRVVRETLDGRMKTPKQRSPRMKEGIAAITSLVYRRTRKKRTR